MEKSKYSIRDPVHGFIHLSEQERQIVDSKPFQRLRNIKQLATANLVYPGAVHTRFDHSLGVMHIAGRIAEHLSEDEVQREGLDEISEIPDELRKKVRLAALCHDLGHGPFSHVSERVIAYVNRDTVNDHDNIHERITAKIIEESCDVKNALNSDFHDVLDIIKGKEIDGVEMRFLSKDIVSGPLDADKMDYGLRDSYFAGVKYGIFDLEKVIESLIIIPSAPNSYLGVKEEGLRALEQMILGKFFLGEQIYYLKTRIAGDILIQRALMLAIHEEREDESYQNILTKSFRVADPSWDVRNYLSFDDYKIIDLISKRKTISGRLMNSFKQRILPKLRFQRNLEAEWIDSIKRTNLYNILRNQNLLFEKEKQIAEVLNLEPFNVFLRLGEKNYPVFGNIRDQIDPNLIFLENEKGVRRSLGEYGESIIKDQRSSKSENVQIFILFSNMEEIRKYDKDKENYENQFSSILSS